MTLTEELFELIETKPITGDDLQTVNLLVLDAITNALAGRNTAPGAKLLAWSRANGQDAGRRAFLMGALTHILETDDLHRASVVHPGCVVIPAAWAVAAREGARGRAFLVAVLKGFEAVCRIGMAVGPGHYQVWHNTATCGPFGSAYAAGSLCHLNGQAMTHALGNAGSQAAGLWQFLATGSMTKHLHAGRGAESGVLAADLAALGFTGPPAILEGEKGFFRAACPDSDSAAVLRAPDAPWQALRTSIKPWPSCRHTHPAIDAAGELRCHGPEAAIRHIDVEIYRVALDVCDRPTPSTDYEAKFSLQHCVAAALTWPQVDFDAFGPEARAALAPLCNKVRCRPAEPYESAYPAAWGCAVTVTLNDGRTHRAEREHAKGDPEKPLSCQEILTKARLLLEFGAIDDTDGLIAQVLALQNDAPVPALPLD